MGFPSSKTSFPPLPEVGGGVFYGELEVYLVVPWKRRTCVQQSAEDFKEKTGGALEAREMDIRWVSKRRNDLIQFGDEIFWGKVVG